MPINSIETLFLNEVKDVYDAEKRLTKALPKMARGVGSEELKTAIEEHLAITQNQVSRMEKVFELLNAKPQAKTCEAMKGLIEEGEEALAETGDENLTDIGVIGAARRVEHYEMAAYKSLIALAAALEKGDKIRDLLQQSLDEEEEADRTLAEVGDNLLEQAESGNEDELEPTTTASSRRK